VSDVAVDNPIIPHVASDRDMIDLRLLDLLQQEVPLVRRPFAELAERVGTSEADVLRRVASLKRRPGGVIRQISAIFDSRALGYQSSLVAAKVDESRIDASAAVISRHPGVSHNYRRNHAYDLWYTVAVPPDSALGLQATVDTLHRLSGASVTRLMPSLRMFKIGVRFDVTGDADPLTRAESSAPAPGSVAAAPFTARESDRAIIRALQQDLPVGAEPFTNLAGEAGVCVEALLEAAGMYQQQGVMRRFAAVLRHREAGFGANAMGAWIVPPDRHEMFGQAAASFAAVTHCYLRPTYEDWPYSIFTMVHGTDRASCESVLAAIAGATGIGDYTALYSTHEYKKTRVRYFTDDVAKWEAEQLRQVGTEDGGAAGARSA
jgi:DNA-binding Lrp family transcriptional regulator